jgi:hypothetical protein
MERRTEGLQARREFWSGHVREWKRSGLSQAGYCRKHRISIKSFAYWKRKLTSSESSTSLVEEQQQGQALKKENRRSFQRSSIFFPAGGRGNVLLFPMLEEQEDRQ